MQIVNKSINTIKVNKNCSGNLIVFFQLSINKTENTFNYFILVLVNWQNKIIKLHISYYLLYLHSCKLIYKCFPQHYLHYDSWHMDISDNFITYYLNIQPCRINVWFYKLQNILLYYFHFFYVIWLLIINRKSIEKPIIAMHFYLFNLM